MNTYIAAIGQEIITAECETVAKAATIIAKAGFGESATAIRVSGIPLGDGMFQAYKIKDNISKKTGKAFRVYQVEGQS